jgi:hypothetical protein
LAVPATDLPDALEIVITPESWVYGCSTTTGAFQRRGVDKRRCDVTRQTAWAAATPAYWPDKNVIFLISIKRGRAKFARSWLCGCADYDEKAQNAEADDQY